MRREDKWGWIVLAVMATVVVQSVAAGLQKARLDEILYSFPADGYQSADDNAVVTINSVIHIIPETDTKPPQVTFEVKTTLKAGQSLTGVRQSVKLDDDVVALLYYPSPYFYTEDPLNLGLGGYPGLVLARTGGFARDLEIESLDELKEKLVKPQLVKISHAAGVELIRVVPEIR